MGTNRRIGVLGWLPLALLAGCVSTSRYNSARADAIRLGEEGSALQSRVERLGRVCDSLSGVVARTAGDRARLERELAEARHETEAARQESVRLQERVAELQSLVAAGSDEASQMLVELQRSQADLEARSERVSELEALVRDREQTIESIRSAVSDALLGFEGKGLTVTVREGKVYVSMEEQLLFRSGSYEVDPEGARAVRDLAAVLAEHADINVLVEGHTDDVPYRPNTYLKDNLDLSAKRATTIVRLLLENRGIEPARVVAAGRGASLPLAEGRTAEARARNRRTEIILTPKYDRLLRLVETPSMP